MTAFVPGGSLVAFDLNNLDLGKAISGGSKLFKAATGLSDADEIKLGREVAANLAARYGLAEDTGALRYLNLVGSTIVQKCSRSNIPYHFGILKSKEVNAWAAPGGYIFVTQGLIDAAQDESELAGVLAHEISHVTQRHIAKAIRQSNLLGAGVDFASASGKNVQALSQISDFSIKLLTNGLSRNDELEADKLGTILAAKVGYNPLGLRDIVQRLGEKSADPSRLAQFNKTHPPAADRLQVIDQALAANHLSDAGPRLSDRFRKAFPKT
jgi:predicted Zn-dependent protease